MYLFHEKTENCELNLLVLFILFTLKLKMAISLLLKVLVILFEMVKVISSIDCNFSVEMTQALLIEGFHRNLTYEIAFVDDKEKNLYDGCKIGIDQELPAGVFSNPDELEELRRSQRLNAKPKNRVNVELSTEQSAPVSVYVITDVIYGQASTWVPVHARYHQAAAGGGTARNNISEPKLFLNCPNNKLDSCGNKYLKTSAVCKEGQENCKWIVLPFDLISNAVVWDVPIGNTDHYYLVALGTLCVVVLGSLHVFKNLHDFKVRINVKLKRKQ